MSSLDNHTPLSFDWGADSAMLLDIFAANESGEVDPALTSIPLLDYTGTDVIRCGRCHNLWGRYGEGLVGFAPMNMTGMLILDPADDDNLYELGAHGEGANAFYDFLQIDEEWLFMVPANANNWGWYNLRTGVYLAGAAHGLGNDAFLKASPCLRNGRPTGVLWNNPAGAVAGPYYIDFETKAITSSGLTLVSARGGALLAETGKFIVGGRIFDPNENTYTSELSLGSGTHFLLLDRTVEQVPYASSAWFNYNFSRELVRQSATWSTGNKLFGGVWAPNGDIVGVPWDEDMIPHRDLARNLVVSGPTISGSDQFNNGVLMPDTRIVFSSRRKDAIYFYQHMADPVAVADSAIALQGPWFNGYT